MDTKNNPLVTNHRNVNSGIFARGGQILFMLIFLGIVLFLGSGNMRWIAAWAYLGISLISVLINAFFLLRINPETVAERGTAKGWQDWDKLVSGLFALALYLLLPLVAAIDARFLWSSEIGRVWQGIGALAYALSMALISWSMISNAYFSTAARIQSDRGQQVCQTGPYRYIRHPGYAGIVIQAVSVAILLGSLWALIPAAMAAGLIIIRTVLEDRMLKQELAGYEAYAHRVKYKLLPGVW